MKCPYCPMDVEPILFSAHLKNCSPKKQESDEERDARMLADEADPGSPVFTRYEKSLLNRGDVKGASASGKRRAQWADRKKAGGSR